MELMEMLTSQLGISDDQAKGGAGLLFQVAKDKLGGQDFGKVADAVPGMDGLLGSAPSGGVMGAIGGLLGGSDLGGLAGLVGGFKELDLDSDMIGKFLPIVLSFVQSKGGDMVKGLLEGALK